MRLEQFSLITDLDEIFKELGVSPTAWRADWIPSDWLVEGVDDFQSTRYAINRHIRRLLSNLAEEKPETFKDTIVIRYYVMDNVERHHWLTAMQEKVAPFLIKHQLA